MRPFAVQLSQLTKTFHPSFWKQPIVVLKNVSWNIQEGQIAALLGPNGSGKSTLLKVVLGLLTPTSGTAEVFGISCRNCIAREHVGFLPERPTFPPFLNAREALAFYGKLSRVAALPAKIEELLVLVGLHEKAHHPIGAYSQGMRQRLGLAQALIHDPKLLILDEPTTGLDPVGLEFLSHLLLELKKSGKTLLLTSHLLTHVEELCDQIGIIDSGKLLYEGAWNARSTKSPLSSLEKLYLKFNLKM